MDINITTAKKLSSKIKKEAKNQIFSGNEITEEFAKEIVRFIDSKNILTKNQTKKSAQVLTLNLCRVKTYSDYYANFVDAVERGLDERFEELLINVLIQTD